MPDIVGFYLSRFIVTPANTLKMIAPFKLDDFSMPAHYDSGIVFYATAEIARHLFRGQPGKHPVGLHTGELRG